MPPGRFEPYRTSAPLHWHEPSQAWLVTRYDDVRRLLLDERLTAQTLQGRIQRLPGLAGSERTALQAFFAAWLSLTDGAGHRRLRQLVAPMFAPSRIEAWATPVGDFARVHARCLDRVDVGASFARPYAAAVVGAVLGLHGSELARALAATGSLVRLLAGPGVGAAGAREGFAALEQTTELVQAVRGRDPGAGRPQPLLHSAVLPVELEVALLVQLVAGGYDPLARCITACATASPVGGAPQLEGQLLDEVFRLHGPFELVPRLASTDLEVGGCPVAAGSRVLLAIGSANRDEARFPDAGVRRPDRPVGHLAFGGGQHRCPASGLARLAVGAALHALADAPRTNREPQRMGVS